MKVVVNARLLMKPYTGIGQFTRGIFGALAGMEESDEFILLVPEEVDFEGGENVRVEVLEERAKGTVGMKKTWWEQIQVPEYAKKVGADALLCTYPCNPWSSDFYKGGMKCVVVVHDCIPWKNSAYRRGLMSRMYHAQTRRAVLKAEKVVTVSKYSRSEIERVCGVERGKISVIHNDVANAYKRSYSDEDVKTVLKKFGLVKGKYLLYVGGYDTRKNVERLIRLFKKSSFGNEIVLVLAGGQLFDSKLYKDFDAGGNNILKTGFLSNNELAMLYSASRFFINLSSEEGFNIPALEALFCGAPLILSDIPVHRELYGDSVTLIDFEKNVDLADIKPKKTLSSDLISENFSWSKSAKKLMTVLKDL